MFTQPQEPVRYEEPKFFTPEELKHTYGSFIFQGSQCSCGHKMKNSSHIAIFGETSDYDLIAECPECGNEVYLDQQIQ